MKKFTFKSIKSRLTFWFLFIALVSLLIVLVVTYIQRVNSIETRTFEKLTAIRDLKVEQLNHWLDERLGDMFVMSGDFEIRGLEKIFEKKTKSTKDIEKLQIAEELLKRNLRSYDDYSEIFIVGVNTGLVEISTSPSVFKENRSHDSYFTVPLKTGEIYIKDIHYSPTTKKSEMTISIPILCLEHNKHIVGILVARLDLQNSLYKMLLNRVGLGETGETLIVNKDVMALNELLWYDNAPMNLKINATPAVNAAQGKTGITVTTDYRGEKVMAAYTYIPKTNWGFVCKQDLHELNAPIRIMILDFIILFALSVILIYLIALYISKTISKPIIGMDIVSKKIKAGDFLVRNTINTQDELGSLAESINEMTDSIESKIFIQKGVVDISETIIRQSSIQEFSVELLKQLMKITGSNMSVFYVLNEESSEYEHFFSIGANEKLLKPFSSKNLAGELGNTISKKEIYYLRNIPEDTIFKFKTTAGDAIPKEIITIPILVDEIVVVLISLVNIHKFSKDSYAILQQSWLNIKTTYSGLIANKRTILLAENLSRSNQRLEAQTEELQVQSEELQSQTEELQQTSEELQEQNVELEMQQNQVEEANRLKSEFLSNMSHELRTPLNSIMALSRVLIMQAADRLTEEENNYLEIVERNGKQLLILINDILDLSKIEAGKMDLTLSQFSLDSAINLIKENLMPLAMEKSLSFHLNINGVIPTVETDAAKLNQVLSNIIGNALKFTEDGEININVSADSEKIYIEVKDTGIGIYEDALPYIFDEFRQVDGTSSRQYAGTGLGLAISYKLIKILGGDIKVVSKHDDGSKFTIVFPIKWQGEVDNTESVEFQPIIPQPLKKTILVVNENPEVVKDISDFLKRTGYNTIGTTFGSKVVELAEKHQPFAITFDVNMSDIDGWEVLQKLKTKDSTKSINAIVVTAKEITQNDKLELSEKVSFVVAKSGVAPQKLYDEIKHILQDLEQYSDFNHAPKEPAEMRILMVEDNESAIVQVKSILTPEGYQIDVARGGQEALDYIQHTVPDGIILDLMMPEVDGFEVLEKIRSIKATSNIPVLILTAKDLSKSDLSKLSVNNIQQLIHKGNVDKDDLLFKIKMMLGTVPKEKHGKKRNIKPTVNNIKITEKSELKSGFPTVLVVEDNQDNMTTVTAILKNKYNILEAYSGEDGLNKAIKQLPDIVLLDMSLPKMDGIEVVNILKRTKETENIPVIALTARAMKEDRDTFIAAGCNDYISKPVDPEVILKKLKEWIKK